MVIGKHLPARLGDTWPGNHTRMDTQVSWTAAPRSLLQVITDSETYLSGSELHIMIYACICKYDIIYILIPKLKAYFQVHTTLFGQLSYHWLQQIYGINPDSLWCMFTTSG